MGISPDWQQHPDKALKHSRPSSICVYVASPGWLLAWAFLPTGMIVLQCSHKYSWKKYIPVTSGKLGNRELCTSGRRDCWKVKINPMLHFPYYVFLQQQKVVEDLIVWVIEVHMQVISLKSITTILQRCLYIEMCLQLMQNTAARLLSGEVDPSS